MSAVDPVHKKIAIQQQDNSILCKFHLAVHSFVMWLQANNMTFTPDGAREGKVKVFRTQITKTDCISETNLNWIKADRQLWWLKHELSSMYIKVTEHQNSKGGCLMQINFRCFTTHWYSADNCLYVCIGIPIMVASCAQCLVVHIIKNEPQTSKHMNNVRTVYQDVRTRLNKQWLRVLNRN